MILHQMIRIVKMRLASLSLIGATIFGLAVGWSSTADGSILYKLTFDNDGVVGSAASNPYVLAPGDVVPTTINRLDPTAGQIATIVLSQRPSCLNALCLTPPTTGNCGYLSPNDAGYVTISAGGGFTLEASFFLNGYAPSIMQGLISQFGAGGINPTLRFQNGTTNNPNLAFSMGQTGASLEWTPPSSLVGAWHTVALVYTRTYTATQSKLELFLDGISVASNVYTTSTSQTLIKGQFAFGVDAPTAATRRVLNGQLDCVAISTDVLGAGTFVLPAPYGQVAPPLIDGTGTQVHPRVCLTPSELPALREYVLTGSTSQGAVGYSKCEAARVALGGTTGAYYPILAALSGGASETNLETLSAGIMQGAFAALIANDVTTAQPVHDALIAYVTNIAYNASIDYSRNLPQLALAYDWLSGIPGCLSDSEVNTVRSWIANACGVYASQLETATWGFLPGAIQNSNWAPWITGGFGTSILSIEGEPGYDPTWYTKASTTLQNYLNEYFSPQGFPAESIHYCSYGLANGVYFLDAMARRGQTVWTHPNFSKLPDYWTSDLFPWGADFNSLADTVDGSTGMAEIYARLAMINPSNEMRWVYSNVWKNYISGYYNPCAMALWGVEPDNTVQVTDLGRPLATYSPQNGLAYMRSAWTGSNDVYLEAQSNPYLYGQSHSHADRGSFTFASGGNLWAMDGGGWVPQAFAHNLVFIDGTAQGFPVMPGSVTQWQDGSFASGMTMNNKAAYDSYMVGTSNACSYNPVVNAYRSVILVRGTHPYALISDNINKDNTAHTYSWRMLTPLSNKIEVLSNTSCLLSPVGTGTCVQYSGSGQLLPYKISFTPATSGTYYTWVLAGHELNEPWNWMYNWALDVTGTIGTTRRNLDSGDNSKAHWQPAAWVSSSTNTWIDPAQGKYLTSGSTYTLQVSVGWGQSDLYAAAIVSGTAVCGLDTTQSFPPAGSSLTWFKDLALPSAGWQKVAPLASTPQLLVQVLSPSTAVMSGNILRRVRPDTPADYGPTMQLQINDIATSEPNFRVVLLPKQSSESSPTITSSSTGATITWTDGTVDSWTFGSNLTLYRNIGSLNFTIPAL